MSTIPHREREAVVIDRDDLPPTPDWTPDPRLAPDFTRTEVKPACQLCKQRLDGRGDQ